MRSTLVRLACLTLAAPLVATTLVASAPAGATPASVSTTTTKATDPFSVFKLHHIQYTKKTKPGKKIRYQFRGTNLGPYEATGGFYFIGVLLPKQTDLKKKVYWDGPSDFQCDWVKLDFYCWGETAQVSDEIWLALDVPLKKTARRGLAKATLYIQTYDVPSGAETLDRDRLKELGITAWTYHKKVATKIVR